MKYEWVPLKCTHCKMFGHTEEHYRKKAPKGPERREWRVKVRGAPQTLSIAIDAAEGDGFQRVAPRHELRTPTRNTPEVTAEDGSKTNSFQLLLDEDLVQRVCPEGGEDLPTPSWIGSPARM